MTIFAHFRVDQATMCPWPTLKKGNRSAPGASTQDGGSQTAKRGIGELTRGANEYLTTQALESDLDLFFPLLAHRWCG